jgi:hypothetical protein
LIVAIAATALVLLLVPLLVWMQRSNAAKEQQPDQWEREHYDQIVAIKTEAEEYAVNGRLPESHEKYRQIAELVGGRKIKDPQLFDLLEQARSDQTRVYGIMLRMMEREAALPATAPTTAAATDTTAPTTADAASTAPAVVLEASPSTNPAAGMQPYPQAYQSFQNAPATRPISQIASSTKATGAKPIPADLISDEQIGAAITKAVAFLLSNFENDELKNQEGMANKVDHDGLNALCVYALLQAGDATRDPRLSIKSDLMKRVIDKMKAHEMKSDGATQVPAVYARSLRCAALSLFNRPEDRAVLRADVDWLLRIHYAGAYTYDDRFAQQKSDAQPAPNPWLQNIDWPGLQILAHNGEPMPPPGSPAVPTMIRATPPTIIYRPQAPPPPMTATRQRTEPAPLTVPWDNSNSQYGLLGVWAGAESGLEIPVKYWQVVEKHWFDCQIPTGQWTYNAPTLQPSFGMTVAGIASLLVTEDYLDSAQQQPPKRGEKIRNQPFNPALTRGLAWLEIEDNSVKILDSGTLFVSYNLYGLERVGLASGFKYFGKHDWYRELAARVIPVQFPNGAFGRQPTGYDAVVETAFTTLFLARGRHPIVMNKLRFEGAWSNRPRDVANVARYLSKQFERPLNWQVTPASRDWPDWTDSPILYIACDEAPFLNEQHIARLRSFAQAGGIIFTHADNGSEKFSTFIEKTLAPKLFPQYEIKDIPAADLIYTAQFPLKAPLPKLRGVWNGSRWLLVHSPTDLANNWQTRNEKAGKNSFDLAANLFLYAEGKSDLRNRLSSIYIPQSPEKPTFVVKIARLKYAGNWDPEPYAWTRFGRWLQWQNDTALSITPVAIADLKSGAAPLAVLTGTAAYAPSPTEIASLRAFVDAGGTLFIDVCGAGGEFASCIEVDLLAKLSAGVKPEPIPPTDPIIAGGGAWNMDDLSKSQYRLGTVDRLGAAGVKLRSLTIGKGRVIYSPIDVTSGLLGTNTLGIIGYTPASANSVAKNVVIQSQNSPQ